MQFSTFGFEYVVSKLVKSCLVKDKTSVLKEDAQSNTRETVGEEDFMLQQLNESCSFFS